MVKTNNGYIEYFFGREVFNSDELKTRIKIIRKVTKKDLMELAKKMRIDTVFYLEGNL